MKARLSFARGLMPGFVLIAAATSPALAHDGTLADYEASLDPREAGRLAGTSSLHAPAGAESSVLPSCRLTLALVDEETKRPLSGLVRITSEDGRVIALPSLVNRGVKLREGHRAKQWYAVTSAGTVMVPRELIRITATGGLETEPTTRTVDLRGQEELQATLPLRRFHDAEKDGWYSGNTHLHLKGLTRDQADEYLRVIPQADGLRMVFVSYLMRKPEDEPYISNAYTDTELRALDNESVQHGWGEEHRHNMHRFEKGYGHVMLLNLRRLIIPVSIGAELTHAAGPDYPALRQGIDTAHRDGATVVWCHNAAGLENVPDVLSGRIDALNIFDNSTGDYAENFYRFLNVGLRVPLSTGTDWFIYDFCRVYARVKGPLTVQNWLDALAAGRTFITNGTLLDLQADRHEIGDTLRLDSPQTVAFTGRATGRNDFGGIDLVCNGEVLAHAASRSEGGHFAATLEFPLRVTEPAWVALRVAGGSLDTGGNVVMSSSQAVLGSGKGYNDLGYPLFGHTSPIYVDFAGRRVFKPDAARALIADLKGSLRTIEDGEHFDNSAQREEIMHIYSEGIDSLTGTLAQWPGERK